MIKEDYVSFETAKLLKEKWFKFIEDKDELSKAYIHAYTKEGEEVWGCYSPDYYPCITINMAMKWLREEHNIDIVITPSMFRKKYNVCIYKDENLCCVDFDGATLSSSYEYACEAAIKYCLENLI